MFVFIGYLCIVEIFIFYCMSDGMFYFVMELFEGLILKMWL